MKFLGSFVSLFIAMNVIGILPIYLSLVEKLSLEERSKVVKIGTFTAFIITLLFTVIGKFVFKLIGITIPDFFVAGGIVLIVLAIGMLTETIYRENFSGTNIASVPLGTPLLAGPGLLTTTLVLINIYGFRITVVALLLNILIAYLILFYAHAIVKLVGIEGTKAMSKIASLLLAALGIMMIRKGILEIIKNF